VTTASFNGSSYLEFLEDDSVTMATSLRIVFRPLSANGIVIYAGGQHVDFISLVLVQSRIQFRFELGSGVGILTGPPLPLGDVHSIVATRMEQNGTLTINGRVVAMGTSGGTSTHLNIGSSVFVGGVSSAVSISPITGATEGFVGCVEEVQVNDDPYRLLEDAVSSQAITQCSSDLCSPNPCLNGGTCSSNSNNTFMCSCVEGYQGNVCQDDVNVFVPYFNTTSYLTYPSLTQSYAYTRVSLEVRPMSSNGVILYNGQLGGGPDFIAVLIRDSVPEFRYNLGSGIAIIRGLSPLITAQWHSIEVIRNGNVGQLIVDSQRPVVGESPGSSFSLQLGANLYLGGVPDYSQINSSIDLDMGFSGCVRTLETTPTNEPINFLDNAIGRTSVLDCPLIGSCEENPCVNNGSCLEDPLNRDITCICQDGFFGETCQFTNIDCTIQSPCQNGGQCVDVVSSNGSTDQTCQCYLPFRGRFCTERTAFSEAMFNGASYLEYDPISFSLERYRLSTGITITVTLAGLNGLLFYIGPSNPSADDYLYIALLDGRPVLRFNLGSGEAMLDHPQQLSNGSEYTITALRNQKSCSLRVETFGEVIGSSPGSSISLDQPTASSVVYVGGSPSPTLLTENTINTGFSGCVQDILLGTSSSQSPFDISSASNGHQTTSC
jgi:hypothetical protein